MLDLSSSFTDLLLHNVALRPRAPGFESITNDQVQLNGLFSTMEAGKCFLDALLSFPIHEYHFISFSEWMRLPTVIMTVARLCIPTQAHAAVGWDVKAAQERVRLDLCLESLCYRMQQLTTYDKAKQPHPDFWYAMRFINDLTKSWYARKIDPISSQATPSLGQTRSDIAELTPATMSTPTTGGGIGFCPVPSENAANMDFGMSFDDRDTFAFMKDLDFDMEQFLDIGIWGDESYTGLGFGR